MIDADMEEDNEAGDEDSTAASTEVRFVPSEKSSRKLLTSHHIYSCIQQAIVNDSHPSTSIIGTAV